MNNKRVFPRIVQTRVVRTSNGSSKSDKFSSVPRIISKKNAKYFYKIYPENTIPEKKWCTTHSPLFEKIFQADQDWAPTQDLRKVTYSDYSIRSPIKSFFKTKRDITNKIFLANLLQKPLEQVSREEYSVPSFYPPTLVYKKQLEFFNEQNKQLFQANQAGKWFLKPSEGYGGTGIVILDRPQKAKSYFNRKAVGFPEETLERDPKKARNLKAEYVLQKGVENLLLFQGYKFDIRVWTLFVFDKNQFQVYLYDDAFMRVSSQLYREGSHHPLINITNLTYHQNQRSKISKTYTFKSQEFYEPAFALIKAACRELVLRLKNSLVASPKGFEIMGYDFILDKEKQPYLLEINRFIGYPANARNQSVVKLVDKMLGDTIDLAIKAQIDQTFSLNANNGWQSIAEFTLD